MVVLLNSKDSNYIILSDINREYHLVYCILSDDILYLR
ncbi:hypothetical protein CSB69_0305 [Morganella morganii]|nr:hypothetical protein CSB69_0305 [Morganella morganii]EMP52181.1 hypothetical protein C790_00652 [Morganella morganii SC01]